MSSVPARAMGLGHRIGTLAPNYDADVVIWDRNPLDLGAYPLQVFIDGVPQLEEREIVAVPEKKMSEKTTVKVLRESEGEEEGSFVLRNVGKMFVKKGENVVAEEKSKGEMVIRVEGGKMICIGDESCAEGAKGAAYDVQGGYVLPVSPIYLLFFPFLEEKLLFILLLHTLYQFLPVPCGPSPPPPKYYRASSLSARRWASSKSSPSPAPPTGSSWPRLLPIHATSSAPSMVSSSVPATSRRLTRLVFSSRLRLRCRNRLSRERASRSRLGANQVGGRLAGRMNWGLP